MDNKLSYHKSVNYSQADPLKVLAQKEGRSTAKNLPFDFKEQDGTRGESAYVFKMGDVWGAFVQEGLGTKSLITQKVYAETGKSHFAALAQDTVACIINDLISVGATPVVLNAYWSSSSYEWLADKTLAEDFIKGWRNACNQAKVTWGGGETQALSGVISDGALEFAGSAFGVIPYENRLIQGKNLQPGDVIMLVESSGVHANGISLIREIAEHLPDGYQTELTDGSILGEVVLKPTHIYAAFLAALHKANLDIHYLSNITGHGWRKIMRAEEDFSYVMTDLPEVPEIFRFIAEQAKNDEREMYGNYNMGAGYAAYLPGTQAIEFTKIATKFGLQTWIGGTVEKGPRQVVIQPLDITYTGDSLEVR